MEFAIVSDRRSKLSPEAFDLLVEQAIARIPVEIRRYLDNIVISVEPRPSAEIIEDLGLSADDTLFGIYWGVPLTEFLDSRVASLSAGVPVGWPRATHHFD
jgi:predicted Zn-dependent protease with MMP-like domain